MLLNSKVGRVLMLALIVLVAIVPLTVSAQDEPNTDLSGELTIVGLGLGDEIATVRADYAQAQMPNVEVVFTEGGFDAQQFLTAVASGNPPDLVRIDRQTLGTYAANGTFMPLADCIASEEIDMSQYREVAVNQVTIDGEIYGIPEFLNSLMLFINTAALEEAGLTVEDVDMSDWEAIATLNEALTVGSGNDLTRIGFDPKLPEFLPLWVQANGGMMLSEDGRTAMLNSSEVVEALEFTVGLLDVAGGWAPFKAFRDTWDFFGSNNQIVADQIGAWPMEQWYMNVLADVSPDGPVAFKAFTDQEGNPLSYATGSAYAIPVGSDNPEAACAFAKAMTSVEAWTAAATERARLRAEAGTINTGVYTANRLADETIFDGGIVTEIENETFQNGVEVILSLQDNAFAMPANPAGAEFQQAWQDAVNRVLNGEQSVQEALDQAQAEAQAALDAAWDN